MTSHKVLHGSAIVLAITNAITAIGLLLVSGWFIAACALAGLSMTAILFNYVVPAAVIRFLAISRIASGYGEKAVGHSSLLTRLNQIRLRIFSRQLAEQSPNDLRGEAIEHLDQGAQAHANWWLTVFHPNVSNMAIIVGSTVILGWLAPNTLPIWVAMVALNGVVIIWMWLAHDANTKRFYQGQRAARSELEYHLESASLWPLSTHLASAARWKGRSRTWLQHRFIARIIDAISESFLILSSGLAICVLLILGSSSMHGSALLMLPVMLLLAFPDWFGNSTRSIQPATHARAAKAAMVTTTQNSALESNVGSSYTVYLGTPQGQPNAVFEPPISLHLKRFQWHYDGQQSVRFGKSINGRFNAGQMIWLKGGSGSGKSSLLKAMAGLIQSRGNIAINRESLEHLLPRQRLALIHYVPQMPYILSDTIKQNIVLAQPVHARVSDQQRKETQLIVQAEQLTQALEFAGLTWQPHEIQQWVGEAGRPLSGGEMKRVGLARAFLWDAPIWLLDEPFEGLDTASITHIQTQLQAMKNNRLIIIASHIWPHQSEPDITIDLDD
ncbi:ATP-binding cassette domain-containing protein [Echinimonas agarilytica]|uniref:ATP-binding cassette domain-containing protein n=1 Tax=Echinimonas agarilytica TaxID=1215918 RepID=UPI002557F4B3|nr:ATP-binding cassette domain-containing protein [Echinimonas agarilytica]